MRLARRAQIAALLAGGSFVPMVRADAASGFAQWQYSAGVLLDQYSDGEPAKWSTAIGAGGEFSPRYDGASGHRAEGYPLGEIRYRDIAYASVSEGLGINFLHRKDQRVGLALNWDFGRPSGRIGDTRGVDRLHSGPLADLYAEQVFLPVVLRADLRHSLIRDDGFKAEFGAYVPLPIGASVVLFAGPSVTLADATAERRQFGVSTADSTSSGFSAFRAGAGLESTHLGLSAVWLINEHWTAEALAAWTHLYGAAAASPLTRKTDSSSFGVAIGYSF